jgi:hypothetical protein
MTPSSKNCANISSVDDGDQNRKKRKEEIDHLFMRMLKKEDGDNSFVPILQYIDYHIRRVNMQGQIEASEVLNAAYIELNVKLTKGERVDTIPALLRTMSKHIVHNALRKARRQGELKTKLKGNTCSSIESNLDCIAMQSRLEQLNNTDKLILEFKASGMKWQEIADYLVEKEGFENSPTLVQNITQRASRARAFLRQD